MRRSIWSPVAVTLLVWAAVAILPHLGLGAWRMPVAGAVWLAPPSWPVPALRESRLAWAEFGRNPFEPSWPPFALRHKQAAGARATAAAAPAGTLAGPLAGPLAFARAEHIGSTVVQRLGALLLTLALAGGAIVLTNKLRGRRALLIRRVSALAKRGLEHSHIARRAGLPRDAVRSLLYEPESGPVRRRA